jgi:autophagy-related protein 2
MSPFSFLYNFTLPSLSSVNAYLPNLFLPENIQQKLVSFVLRRTLGKFVQHDGLLGDKVETQVASGRIAFGRLELDQQVCLRYIMEGIVAPRLTQ